MHATSKLACLPAHATWGSQTSSQILVQFSEWRLWCLSDHSLQASCIARGMWLLQLYLEWGLFTAWTDHDALKWISNLAGSRSKLVSWRVQTSKFAYDLIQGAGIKHHTADALSWLKTIGTDLIPAKKKVLLLCITTSILHLAPKKE